MDKEKELWKILEKYGMNPMLTPNCGEEILDLIDIKKFAFYVIGDKELSEIYFNAWLKSKSKPQP